MGGGRHDKRSDGGYKTGTTWQEGGGVGGGEAIGQRRLDEETRGAAGQAGRGRRLHCGMVVMFA
jgi:hypothetical protein